MTLDEFDHELEVYYNSITSNSAPGLNNYEKSVLLTLAQEDIIKSYFNLRKNKQQQGIDDSIERQHAFNSLIKVANGVPVPSSEVNPLDGRGKCFYLSAHSLFIINETCSDNNRRYTVTPLSHEEYDRLMLKPYQYPPKRMIWRLTSGTAEFPDTEDPNKKVQRVIVELIGNFDEDSLTYKMRYVKRPAPIILNHIDEEDYTINGIKGPSECELDESVHRDIVRRAAELGKSYYMGDLQSQLLLGQTSQTDLGIIQSNSNR